MADTTDLQRLVVSLEARYASMERELRKANGVANKQARAIETRFQKMNTNVSASFGRLGGLLAGAFSIRAAQQLIDASTRIQNSLKVAGLSGEELTRVYDRLFQSAQKNAAPLEALVDLYGRASLVQKELGVSTEELLSFTDKVAVALRVSGRSAAESSGALLQLSQALGSGVVRAEEFNSILEGALPIAQAAAAGLTEAGGSVSKLRQLVVDGKISSEAFFRAFEAGAPILEEKVAGAELTLSQRFVRLQNVMIDAAGRFDDVTGASRGAASALDLLAEVIQAITDRSSPFMQAISGYIAGVNGMGAATRDFVNDPSLEKFWRVMWGGGPVNAADTGAVTGRLAEVNRQIAEIQANAFGPGSTENSRGIATSLLATLKAEADSLNSELAKVSQQIAATYDPLSSAGTGLPARGSPSPVKPVSLDDYGAPGKSGSGKSDAEKAADKIAEVRKELAFEAAQLTRTAREQEIYNRLKAAGVDLNSADGAAIAEATGKLYDQQQALEAVRNVVEDVGGGAFDAFSQFVEGSQSAEDAIKDLIKQLLLAEARALFLNAITGGTSDLGPIASLISGARANGGPVSAGKAYLVGERGPELMVPRMAGAVIPNGTMKGRGGNGAMTIAVEVSGARGNTEIMEMVSSGVRRGLGEYDRTLPGRVGQINQAPRRRGH